MKEIFLNDKGVGDDLFPFALIRHVADIRVGILTIQEKWERLSNFPVFKHSENQLSPGNAINVSANIIPSKEFAALVSTLPNEYDISVFNPDICKVVQYPWHIFQFNDWALRQDFELITSGRVSATIPKTVQAIETKNIFIEEGARLSNCILNASTGPIYIGNDSEIMEGAIIRGPFALCEGSVVKMGARIYGATTIGPHSIVGGEIKNTVVFGYSNKAHDGYLGDSIIGEWCNLGAGSSNSNLKNNATEVKVWNPLSEKWSNAGMKCGLLMGDYSRSAINTSFNTGTMVGVCSNVFGEGLTPTYIPNFSWGYKPVEKYKFDKGIRDIDNWKKLKSKALTEGEIKQLRNIFNQS